MTNEQIAIKHRAYNLGRKVDDTPASWLTLEEFTKRFYPTHK